MKLTMNEILEIENYTQMFIEHENADILINGYCDRELEYMKLDLQFFAKKTIEKDDKQMKTLKVAYKTIEVKKSMPVAYKEGNKVKTVFRTVKQDEKGFFVSINKERQYIAKSDKAFKGITTVIIEGKNAINSKPEKKKRVKKEKETISIDVSFPQIVIPQNILTTFGEDVYNTIEALCIQAIEGVTIGDKHIKGWNALTGEHKEMKAFMAQDGLKALESVQTFQELQATMITYFLSDMTKRMISKYVQMGVYYKKLDKRTEGNKMYMFSYQNAPSSDERLAYEVDEVFNELLTVAYTKTFSKSMFDNVAYASTSIFFRISNVVRKMRGKATNRIIRELKNNHVESVTTFNTNLFNELDFLNETEKDIMNKIIEGYSLKEIDQMKEKRMDRQVKGMRKKLEELSGMTIKESKKEQKALIQKQKEAKKEMIERKKEEMKEAPSMELGKIVKRYTLDELNNMNHGTMEKSLNAPNIDMVESMDRMKKLFNSKAI